MSKFYNHLKNVPTRLLLFWWNDRYGKYHEKIDGNLYLEGLYLYKGDSYFFSEDVLKSELNTREHIPNKKEAIILRKNAKMSSNKNSELLKRSPIRKRTN